MDRANESFVYWGSSEDYSPDRRMVLRTLNSRDVTIADLNGDKYPELIFANEGNTDEEAGALRASEDHSERPSTHLPGERTSALTVTDLNGDGFPEIVLANAYRLKSRELGMYNTVDNCSPQGDLPSLDPHEQLINVPSVAQPTLLPSNQLGGLGAEFNLRHQQRMVSWETMTPRSANRSSTSRRLSVNRW